MTWRDLGTFGLTNDWQFTPNITSSIVRITHLNVVSTLNIRGLIAQAISEDISFFDMRSFRQRTEKEVFLMLNFEGLLIKKLAIRRTDLTDIDWNIKIEELEGVSDINLPLGIADVSGLQAALSGKANTNHQHQIIDVAGLEAQLSEKAIALDVETALLSKSPTNHQHAIADVSGLGTALSEKAIASVVEAALLGKAPTNHQHAITEVTGLEAQLSEKAIASVVEAALLGKAPTNHQHAITDVTGLEAQLAAKAIASVVEAALLGKAPTNHQHQIADVSGLEAQLSEKAIADDVTALIDSYYSYTNEELASKVSNNFYQAKTEEIYRDLDTKAIASVVEAALLGKAPTNHQHAITEVTGLEAQLSEKAIASDVSNALAALGQDIGDAYNYAEQVNSRLNFKIFASSSFPGISLENGSIWHELAANGDYKESWTLFGGIWRSTTTYKIDYFGPSSGITGTASYQLPLDDRYAYFFKAYFVHCIYNSGTVDATTNYYRAIVTTQPTGTTFANSGPIPNDNLTKRFAINQLFTPAIGERLIFNPQKLGAAPSAKIAMSLTYHLVRK